MKILLVEDLEEVAVATREILESYGHQVEVASSGSEALEILAGESHGFDAMITDLHLPGISGTDLLVHLLHRGTSLALLAYSASRGDPTLRRLVFDGRVLFLRKPFSAEDLVSRLDAAVEARNLPVKLPMSLVELLEPEKPIKPPQRRARHRGWLAAATFVILLAGGLLFSTSRAPELPPVPGSGNLRGVALEGTFPSGELLELPRELRWHGIPEASSYRARILGVDETLLWQGETASERLQIEPKKLSWLHRSVVYSWTVEALDAKGRVLSTSQKARFLVRPTENLPL